MPIKNVSAAAVLQARLSKPIKTAADTRAVQKMIGFVLLDNQGILGELKSTVLGENGAPGLKTLVAVLTERIDNIDKHIKIPKENKRIDTFGKVINWFTDKALPPLFVVGITWGIIFFLNVYFHVEVFGNPVIKP